MTMAIVDNQLGDTQLYPDQPGAGECTPRKKEAVDQDAVAETVEVKDSQDGLPPAEAAELKSSLIRKRKNPLRKCNPLRKRRHPLQVQPQDWQARSPCLLSSLTGPL